MVILKLGKRVRMPSWHSESRSFFLAVVALAVLVPAATACGGGGGGGGPTAPPPPQPIQIGGSWPDASCVVTGAQGPNSLCLVQLFRAAKGIPFAASAEVTQAGGNVTINVQLAGEPINPFSGTIDANGTVMTSIPDANLGERTLITCGGIVYGYTLIDSTLNGSASPSSLNLKVVESANVDFLGILLGEVKLIKDLDASR